MLLLILKTQDFQLRRYKSVFLISTLITYTFTSKQPWARAEVKNRLQAHSTCRGRSFLLHRAGKTNYHNKLKVRQVREDIQRKMRENKTAYMLSKSKHS